MPNPIVARSFADVAGVAHGFFTRQGGVSQGVYASLNCGRGSRDERTCVEENRRRVAEHIGVPQAHLLTCHQIHSATARVVTHAWRPEENPKVDALVTAVPGLAIAVLAADCAPVLFLDAEARVIGAAHAGWRGALSGILEATVAAMESLGAQRTRLRAALGPCIGPDAYEVGPEFEAQFLSSDAANARFFRRSAASARAHFDLPRYVLHRLGLAGIGSVENAARCTYLNEEHFFSYRRTTHRREADYGRQISAIVLAS